MIGLARRLQNRDSRPLSIWIVLLTVSAALGGCLADEEALDPTTSTNDPEGAPASGNASSKGEDAGKNETATSSPPTASNGTSEQDAQDRGGNETREGGNATTDQRTQAARPGWPDPAQAPIRPGIAINPIGSFLPDNEGGGCTANFLFRTPDNGTLLLGTAGHCVDDRRTANLTGSGTYEAKVVFAANNESLDFGLLEIDESYRDKVHPKMLYWGGPAGIDPTPAPGTEIRLFGSTAVRGGWDELSPFRGAVISHCDARIYAHVPGTGPGDSGSPAITSGGDAIGWLLGPSPGVCSDLQPKNAIRFMPITEALTHAEAELGIELELVMWAEVHPDRLLPP